MDKKYYLAVDIGASSGRHILGSLENGKMVLEEVYRFYNGAKDVNGKLVWDTDNLYRSIVEGLKKCKEVGKIPTFMGIDTWGVDYALLDDKDNLLGEIYSYRDDRTALMMDKVHNIVSEDELYSRTGITKQQFNTVYQLYDDKLSGKMDKAETFLMMPDYLGFLLTGVKRNEYTNASTTGMLNAKDRSWDYEVIEKLGYKKSLFKPLSKPGTTVGDLKEELKKELGFNVKVVLPATHDTASAVMAVPSNGKALYISSGTWSLMGVETECENTQASSKKAGFTNEGGYNNTIRFLKNIMGLWMIQNIKKEYNDKYSFSELMNLAKEVKNFSSIVEVNDNSFFAPKSMIEAVKEYCKKTNQKVPESVGEIVYCVYTSLAKCYADTVKNLENIFSCKYNAVNIVGGGCQNTMLNELTAKYTGKKVVAGPIEATATGNILAQMIAGKDIADLASGRNIIKNSFDIKEIEG